jgi:hypothetical protein
MTCTIHGDNCPARVIGVQPIGKHYDFHLRASQIGFTIENKRSGLCVNGTIYSDFTVGYDNPEWLPKYVRAKVRTMVKSLDKYFTIPEVS